MQTKITGNYSHAVQDCVWGNMQRRSSLKLFQTSNEEFGMINVEYTN